MDRTTALEILEAVRPGTTDEAEPEVRAAAEALRNDPDAADLAARRQEIDCRIAAAMQDVAVPAAAKARLLARILHASRVPFAAEVGAAASRTTDATPSSSPAPVTSKPAASPSAVASQLSVASQSNGRRRAVKWSAAVAALLLLVAVGAFWRQSVSHFGPTITLDDLARSAPTVAAEPQPYTGRFVPQLPSTPGWNTARITFGDAPQAAFVGEAPRRQAAAYPFGVTVRRNQVVQGWLLVAPADRLIDPPSADSFQLTSVRYENGLASVAWTEGNLVFVCVVRGGEESLRAVEWALDRRFS